MPRRKTYQDGSLEELTRNSGNWTFRIREFDHQDGKWKQRRFRLGKDKKDAQKTAQKIRAEINECNNTNPKKLFARITFKEFTETYWEEYTVRENFQPATLDSRYNLLKNHLLPAFGKMKLQDIEPKDIGNLLNSLYAKKYAGSSILFIYTFTKSLFALAKQHELIKKNPVKAKRHRPKVPKVKKTTISSKQISEIISRLSNADEKMMALLLSLSAMRVGEAMALRWEDFNSATGQLTINHSLYKYQLKEPKTENSVATLHLEPLVASLLRPHYDRATFQEPHDFIFCRKDGSPMCYSTCIRHLHDAIEEAGSSSRKASMGFTSSGTRRQLWRTTRVVT